jgi:hypothetical protein
MNKLILISLDILCGLFLIIAAFILKPTYFSSKISILLTIGSIVPGLFLSGISRNIVVSNILQKETLYKALIYSIVFNFIVLSLYFFLSDKENSDFSLFLFLILAISFSSSSQVLSRAWFYIYGKTKLFFQIKFLTTFFRFIFIFFAYIFDEISLILMSAVFISSLEMLFGLFAFFSKNIKLKKNKNLKKEHIENLAVGASVGISRLSISTLKILIENYIGQILSHLLIFEQISIGLASIYEKYYVRSFTETKKIYIGKFLFNTFIFIFLFNIPLFNESSNFRIPLILLISLSSIFPISSNYELIKQKGVMAYSRNSLINSFFVFLFLGLNYFYIKFSFLYLFIYVISFTLPLYLNYQSKFSKSY